MAAALQTSLNGLARAMVQQGRLKEAEAEEIAAKGASSGGFVQQLIAARRMSARELATFAAETFGYPLLDLDAYAEEHLLRDAIDKRVMQNQQVVALLRRGNRLAVALADPTNLRALDEIRFQTGLAVDPVVVEADKLAALVGKLVETPEQSLQSLVGEDIDFQFEEEGPVDTASEAAAAEVEPHDARARRRAPFPSARAICVAGIGWSYLALPLAHYLFGTPNEFKYITAASNFFALNVALQVSILGIAFALAVGATKFREKTKDK